MAVDRIIRVRYAATIGDFATRLPNVSERADLSSLDSDFRETRSPI